jgi:threonine dehydrogenase-like Zn-dependent dehydrogenase
LLVAATAKASGAQEVRLVARYQHQLSKAESLGAQPLAEEAVADADLSQGSDIVLETTGSESAFALIPKLVRKGGTVVLAGGYPEPIHANFAPIVGMELSLVGSLCYGWCRTRLEFETAVDLIRTGRVHATSIVTHTLPFSSIAKAFDIALRKESGAIKVQLRFD